MRKAQQDGQPDRDGAPAAPDATPAQPKYGMLLPEGASIEDFIVPRIPRSKPEEREAPQENPAQDAHPHRAPHAPPPGYRQPEYQQPEYQQPEYQPADPIQYTQPWDAQPWDAQAGYQQPGYAQPGYPQPGDPYPGDYGQPQYPYPSRLPVDTPEERARSRRRKRAVTVAILSALGMILLPILGITVGTVGVLGDNTDALVSSVPLSNGGTVRLPEDETRVISALGGAELNQCTVTDPDGKKLEVETVTGATTRENTAALPGARFQTTKAGQYTVSCAELEDGARMLIGPPVVVRNAAATGAWMLGGLFLGGVSMAIFVWSLITLRRTRRPAR